MLSTDLTPFVAPLPLFNDTPDAAAMICCDYDAYDAILHRTFVKTCSAAWLKPLEESVSLGICIRVQTNHFRVFPYENPNLAEFEAGVRALNPFVAVKTRSAAIHTACSNVSDTADAIYIDAETRIQVLDTMSHLPTADKEQCGAFIRDERVLVVWSDELDDIVPMVNDLEDKLFKLIWRSRALTAEAAATPTASSSLKRRKSSWSYKLSDPAVAAAREKDPEKDGDKADMRPIRLFAPFYGGLAAALSLYFVGAGVATLLTESTLDGTWTRWALLVTSPFLFCISLFFSLQIIINVSFIIGPVAQFHENSRYYSAVKPVSNPKVDNALPHITIEMPVYKENLEATITPSIVSIKKAMQTYARQGGTSSIFLHDDGLQLLSAKDREERIAFYANHQIGWVARPGHSSEPDGFKRAGRFKKASNMNFGIELSLKMEKHLLELEKHIWADEGKEFWKEVDGKEQSLEDRALARAIDEMYEETGKKWKPWAANGKALRMGELILIVDSDTIVPIDCFRDAARELAECPEVAIIQHESDVMQVAHHYFENGITHFTRRINKVISMGCANGEVAPFVGHNAFLRWSAIQDAAFIDHADGKSKWWSEENVSEDFDMALRLQLKGYTIRWSTYSDGGFKEGVSLTIDDELNRWQKYAYGSNELLFNPVIDWWKLGPVTKKLRIFVWSDAALHYKLTMLAYMFSYYGIACAAILSTLNYILLGFAFNIDGFYQHSFEIWVACCVVFPVLGNVGYTLLVYRLGIRSLVSVLLENVTWIPFFFFFFGGLSIHLSTALLAHVVSYNITWGATIKEVERSNFFIEVPRIWKRFWFSFVLCIILLVAMIVLGTSALPEEWRIPLSDWAVGLPLFIVIGCHLLFPVVLNPYLMIFSY